MKYKVGDKTVLGEITGKVNGKSGQQLYYVAGRSDGYWLTESEIDAIIIKPKRNIDAVMDMWDKGNLEDAIDFFRDHVRHMSTYEDIVALREPYAEPSRYPKLTPEELKAVKWLVEGGFETIEKRSGFAIATQIGDVGMVLFESLAITKLMKDVSWITTEPINLAELLAAQEEKIT